MKLALIVNPTASSVSGRQRVLLHTTLTEGHTLTVHETSRRGHATRLAHRCYRDGYDAVFALGGDGTANEVANGLLASECPLVPLPGGSTNVFARSLGYINNPVDAARQALAALAEGSVERTHVGTVNDRAFLFHIGVGFDAAVVHRVEQRSMLKRFAGHPWFLACAVAGWNEAVRSTDTFSAVMYPSTDGPTGMRAQRLDGLKMAVALNTNPYTYLGNRPVNLAPEATTTSPLSLVGVRSLALDRLAPAARAAFAKNTAGLPNKGTMHHHHSLRSITFEASTPFAYQFDGEPMAPVTSLTVTDVADALSIARPQPL